MKKTILYVLLAVCLLIGAVGGFLLGRRSGSDAAATPETEASALAVEENADGVELGEETEETDQIPAVPLLDYEALRASHEADEIVAVVNGEEFDWETYFYWLWSQAVSVENYFQQMAVYYGASAAWTDAADDSGTSYADVTLDSVEDALLQVASIRGFAAENKVSLREEDYAAIAEQLASDIVSACGEGATEEEFNEYIASIYLPRKLYDSMNEVNYLYQDTYLALYGEAGARVSDEDARNYLTENEYMSANHILFMNYDPETYEALDDEALAEKLALAETLAAELQAIEDPAARLARFLELKEEYCEDSGKAYYPDGYIFQPGDMVQEFEDATLSLAEYEVSDPVESTYGWHVIMRLPLDVDGVVEYSNAGTPMTARSLYANEAYGALLQAYYDSLSVEYAEGFTRPNLLDYITEPED